MARAGKHIRLTDVSGMKHADGIKAVVMLDNLHSSITSCIQPPWQPQQTADIDLDILLWKS